MLLDALTSSRILNLKFSFLLWEAAEGICVVFLQPLSLCSLMMYSDSEPFRKCMVGGLPHCLLEA
jgi:hypothetical protein